jgi:hypothetical protein
MVVMVMVMIVVAMVDVDDKDRWEQGITSQVEGSEGKGTKANIKLTSVLF